MIFHIVIPVFNRLQLTVRCLESLLAQSDKGTDIVLIDDGSTDGTAQYVPRRFPEVQMIRGDGTLWWSGATNLGIRKVLQSAAPDDYVLLVNNDTYFDPDFVARCRKAARRHPASLVGSVLVDPRDRRILQGGIRINWYTAKATLLNIGKRIDDFPPAHIEPVSVVTGRGVLVPCAIYRRLGLYDDKCLEHYGGDTELAKRAALKGYPLVVDYDLVTYNSDPMETVRDTFYRPLDLFRYLFSRKSKMHLRSRFWFAIKTATNPLQAASYFVCDIARILKHFAFRIRIGPVRKGDVA